MIKGDLVIKHGDADRGKIGIVLEARENSLGHGFVKVLTADGVIKIWYAKLVKVIK